MKSSTWLYTHSFAQIILQNKNESERSRKTPSWEQRESSVDQQKFYCLQYDTVYTVSITIYMQL